VDFIKLISELEDDFEKVTIEESRDGFVCLGPIWINLTIARWLYALIENNITHKKKVSY